MENDDIELGYYGLALRRRWWLVALTALAVVALAVMLVPKQVTTYRSEATVLVEDVSLDAIEGLGRGSGVNEATEVGIASSDPVIRATIDKLDLGVDVDDFKADLTVSGDDGAQLLSFVYEGKVKANVAQIAETVADQYLDFKVLTVVQQRNNRLGNYDTRIAELDANIAQATQDFQESAPDPNADPPETESAEHVLAGATLRRLNDERGDLVAIANRLRTADLSVGSVIGKASAPEEIQSGIDRRLALAVAVVMGLLGGLALALFTDRVDRRVRDIDDIEGELDAPVVGNIPRITEETPVLVTAVRAETAGANAYRRFGTAVLASGGDDLHSVLITSANEKEGRTTSVVNTALALRQAGQLVYIVSSDRQNPDIDEVFGLAGLEGLDHFFRSEVTPADVARLFDQAPNQLGLRMIASGIGSRVPQPLSVAGLRAILAEGRRRDAVLLFDAPPALAHPDALSIASLVDATYVVVGRGRSRRQDLADLRMQLRHVNANVAGAVRNQSSRWKVGKADSLTAVSSAAKEQLPNAS